MSFDHLSSSADYLVSNNTTFNIFNNFLFYKTFKFLTFSINLNCHRIVDFCVHLPVQLYLYIKLHSNCIFIYDEGNTSGVQYLTSYHLGSVLITTQRFSVCRRFKPLPRFFFSTCIVLLILRNKFPYHSPINYTHSCVITAGTGQANTLNCKIV